MEPKQKITLNSTACSRRPLQHVVCVWIKAEGADLELVRSGDVTAKWVDSAMELHTPVRRFGALGRKAEVFEPTRICNTAVAAFFVFHASNLPQRWSFWNEPLYNGDKPKSWVITRDKPAYCTDFYTSSFCLWALDGLKWAEVWLHGTICVCPCVTSS